MSHIMRKPAFKFAKIKGTDQPTYMQFQCLCYKLPRYRKVPKFLDGRKLSCNLPKIPTKRPKLRVFYQNDANGIANSEDPDQTAPQGAV